MEAGAGGGVEAGLCDRCQHQRVITSGKGSRFSLCQRAAQDPRFPRYPRLPVVRCAGFEPRDDAKPPTGSAAP